MALSGENGARQLAFVLSPNRRIDNPDLSQGRYLLLRRMRYEKVTTMESGRPLARHMDPSVSLKAEVMVVEPACEKRGSEKQGSAILQHGGVFAIHATGTLWARRHARVR